MSVVQNAEIKDCRLGFDREVFLCAWVTLHYGGGLHQGYGGYCLAKAVDGRYEGWDKAGEKLAELLSVVGVENFADLKGARIRVRTDTEATFGSKVLAIGHFIEDKWFSWKDEEGDRE